MIRTNQSTIKNAGEVSQLWAYLDSGALVGEGWVEESGDNIHDSHSYVLFHGLVCMLSIMGSITYLKVQQITHSQHVIHNTKFQS